MRVAIDDQIFNHQRRGGVSRVFTALARELDGRDGIELGVDARVSSNDHLLTAFPRVRRVTHDGRVGARVQELVNRPRPGRRPDVLHHTWYKERYLRRPARTRVSTVHDLWPERTDPALAVSPDNPKRRFVEGSDVVACVSQATADDLVDLWGEPRALLGVTPLGVDRLFFEPPAATPTGEPYVLFVGHRSAYKNFTVLLEAFAAAARQDPALTLWCVGGGAFDDAEVRRLDELGLTGRVGQRTVDDRELVALYHHARVFTFPSRHEGFGLPVLEAMATGCPVVISTAAALQEVAGGHAQVLDPDDVDAWSHALVTDRRAEPGAEADLAAAREWARGFGWDRFADRTLDLYRQAQSIGAEG